MIDKRNQDVRHIAAFQNDEDLVTDFTWYGMDWGAPAPADDGLSIVEANDVISPK